MIALYQVHYAAFGAIPGHVGFDKIEVGENGHVVDEAFGGWRKAQSEHFKDGGVFDSIYTQ